MYRKSHSHRAKAPEDDILEKHSLIKTPVCRPTAHREMEGGREREKSAVSEDGDAAKFKRKSSFSSSPPQQSPRLIGGKTLPGLE